MLAYLSQFLKSYSLLSPTSYVVSTSLLLRIFKNSLIQQFLGLFFFNQQVGSTNLSNQKSFYFIFSFFLLICFLPPVFFYSYHWLDFFPPNSLS